MSDGAGYVVCEWQGAFARGDLYIHVRSYRKRLGELSTETDVVESGSSNRAGQA